MICSRRAMGRALFCALLLAGSAPALPQNIGRQLGERLGQAIRDGLSGRTAPPSGRNRTPIVREPLPSYPERIRGGSYTIDKKVADVQVPRGCTGEFVVRFKVTDAQLRRDTLFNSMQDPGTYTVLASTAHREASPLGGLPRCESIPIRVLSPDGQEIARDTLLGASGSYVSAKVNGAQQAVARSDLFPGGGYTPQDVKALRERLTTRANVWYRHQSACSRPDASSPQCSGAAPPSPQQDHAALVRAIGVYASGVPATYDGLRSLQKVDAEFNTWSFGSREKLPVYGEITAVTEARRKQIEDQIRPQIMADLNKPGNEQLMSDLFGSRGEKYEPYRYHREQVSQIPARADRSPPFYARTGEEPQSDRERRQAASFASWTEPTSDEIALAMLRELRLAGGRQLSPTTVMVPNVGNRFGSALVNAFTVPVSLQIHDVQKTRCQKASGGYRCSYRIWKRAIMPNSAARDPFYALMYRFLNEPYAGGGTMLVTPTRAGWRLPEFERAIVNAHGQQAQGLGQFFQGAVEAGGNAIGTMTDQFDRSGGGKSQMEEEREERVKDAEERQRRSR